MSWRVFIAAAVFMSLVLAGCGQKEEEKATPASASSAPATPLRVFADIQAGIEQHIEEQVRLGGGHFHLPFQGKQLLLKLVRVHTEYLSKLGPGRYFACVDLADIGGDVYDVDFFLAGELGAMKVTETTVHKINGQPFYAWKQKSDGTWQRVPVKEASDALLGVIKGQDEFEFSYRAILPEITGTARLWLPLASTDPFQNVAVKAINVPEKESILEEREHGNRVLFLELGPKDSRKDVEIRYKVRRLEKAAYAARTPDQAKYLKPERLVPTNEDFRRIAEQVVEGKKGDLVRARALYDHVIDRMRYMKYGDGWGKGDAVYACNARTGNCTDFHSTSLPWPGRWVSRRGSPSLRSATRAAWTAITAGRSSLPRANGGPWTSAKAISIRTWQPIILATIRPIALRSAGAATWLWNRDLFQAR
jgi:hypothetical protein